MALPNYESNLNTKGRITKGIRLFYGAVGATPTTEVFNVQAIPDMGGTAETIEVTTFEDQVVAAILHGVFAC